MIVEPGILRALSSLCTAHNFKAIIAAVISACRLKAALASKSKSTIAIPVSLLCSFVMGRLNDSATIFFSFEMCFSFT